MNGSHLGLLPKQLLECSFGHLQQCKTDLYCSGLQLLPAAVPLGHTQSTKQILACRQFSPAPHLSLLNTVMDYTVQGTVKVCLQELCACVVKRLTGYLMAGVIALLIWF